MNRLSFISQVVYRLKRRYGMPIDIVYLVSSVTNLETGAKTVLKGAVRVSRAILLPSVIHREFAYDLTFVATNKNFTYGGHFDTTVKQLIIDRKDLPFGFEIKPGMYFLFDGVRVDVQKVEDFEDNRSYFIQAKQDNSIAVETIHYANADSAVEFEQEAEGEL